MKKSRTSLFRTLILSLVLLVTVFIIVIAWFSSETNDATASGLSVKSKPGTGLEVSFTDDENSEWSSEISNDTLKSYPLITSNGIVKDVTGTNFFLPTLNRSTGVPTLNIEGTSWGVKRDAVANKDYFETDLYFRSKEALNVSLMTDSAVTPKDASGNKSDFGDFSKDYIAGAARVGFYDADETLKFIWAPNPNYELTDSGDFTKIEPETTTVGGGVTFNPNGNGTFKEKWWMDILQGGYPVTDSGYESIQAKTLYYFDYKKSGALKSINMKYNKDLGEYQAVIDFTDQYTDNMIAIFNNGDSVTQDFLQYQQWIAGSPDFKKLEKKGFDIEYQINTTQNETIPSSGTETKYQWVKLYLKVNQKPAGATYTNWQVKVTYNPETKVLKVDDFIYYRDENNFVATDGIESLIGGTTTYKYEISTDKSLAITAEDGENRYGLAVDNDNIVTKKIGASSDTTIPFVRSEFLFKAEKGSSGNSYKIKSNKAGKYLAISGTSLVLNDTGTEFTLSVGANGPLLGYNGTYIGYASSTFGAVSDINTAIAIFQGNAAYNFINNGTTQEEYKCLLKGTNVLTTLNRVSTNVSSFPTTNPIVDDLNYIENVPLVVLQQDGEYYKGHIKVRIWAEGTDDEAKTPLAFGTFNTSLKFIGSKDSSSNQGS